MKKLHTVILPALGLLGTAGCGDHVDGRDAEQKVANIAEQTMKSKVASVRCPEPERRAGVVFECQVTFAEGGEHAMRLRLLDDHGNFEPTWTRPIVSMARLAEAFAQDVPRGDGAAPTVDCGAGVKEITTDGFACTVARAGRPPETITLDVDPRDLSWTRR